jgi:hypothetical protein
MRTVCDENHILKITTLTALSSAKCFSPDETTDEYLAINPFPAVLFFMGLFAQSV